MTSKFSFPNIVAQKKHSPFFFLKKTSNEFQIFPSLDCHLAQGGARDDGKLGRELGSHKFQTSRLKSQPKMVN